MRTKERWNFYDKNGDGSGTTDFFVLWILGARHEGSWEKENQREDVNRR